MPVLGLSEACLSFRHEDRPVLGLSEACLKDTKTGLSWACLRLVLRTRGQADEVFISTARPLAVEHVKYTAADVVALFILEDAVSPRTRAALFI